jgi:hypothetical protein
MSKGFKIICQKAGYTRAIVRGCLYLILVLASCTGKKPAMKQADLDRLKPFADSSHLIPVIILERYESAPCHDNKVTANVYKVQHLALKDTLFVFDVCNKMFWTEEDEGLFIVEISPAITDQVLIPIDSRIPPGSRYLFGVLKHATL